MIRTYYDNLQVARTASDTVIRAAYKSLAQKYHPDRFDGDPAAADRIMKLLNEAYAVLSDPKRRKEHDKWIDEQFGTNERSRSSKTEEYVRAHPEGPPTDRTDGGSGMQPIGGTDSQSKSRKSPMVVGLIVILGLWIWGIFYSVNQTSATEELAKSASAAARQSEEIEARRLAQSRMQAQELAARAKSVEQVATEGQQAEAKLAPTAQSEGAKLSQPEASSNESSRGTTKTPVIVRPSTRQYHEEMVEYAVERGKPAMLPSGPSNIEAGSGSRATRVSTKWKKRVVIEDTNYDPAVAEAERVKKAAILQAAKDQAAIRERECVIKPLMTAADNAKCGIGR
jgi:curved DNA-binding protein CbpA